MTQLFKVPGTFQTESGYLLNGLEIAYTTKGQICGDCSNVVWVIHALTANSDFESWWPGLFGAGAVFDSSEHFIICANNLGSCYGTTGPMSVNPATGEPYYHDFPAFSIRDMANVLQLLAIHLKVARIGYLIGASLGGQIALEWAIAWGERVSNLVLLATNAVHAPWGIAFNAAQRMAIEADPSWKTKSKQAGAAGLAAARAVALLSYRNYTSYQLSQSEYNSAKTDNFLADGYQRYQGEKFIKRFNAYSYYWLSKAMDGHNVSRGRDSFSNALGKISARTIIFNVDTDILFPLSEQQMLVRYIPNAALLQIVSDYGHDGFLLETKQISKHLYQFKLMQYQEL